MGFTHITAVMPKIEAEGLNPLVELEKEEKRLNIWVTAQEIIRVTLSWSVSIGENALVLGDTWERGYGDLEWKTPEASRVLPWYVMIHENGKTDGYGVRTGCAAFCHWRVTSSCLTLVLDLRNGGSSTLLNGRKLLAASVVCREGRENESAYDSTRALCTMMCPELRLPAEPVYGINNWYYAYGVSSDREILRDAETLAKLSAGISVRPFVVIDDGWQTAHTGSYNGGPWNRSNSAFPDMKALAEGIREKDLRPGVWFRPLVTCESFPAECSLPRDPTIYDPDTVGWRILDPSHPFVLDKVREMIRGLKAWGYELIKHDFSTVDIFGRWGVDMGDEMTRSGWRFHDETKTTAEIILNLYRALREGAGNDTLVLGCNTVSHLSAGIFDLMRTGDDTSGREWARTVKMGVNTLAFRLPQHNTFYSADADCVGITPLIPWEKNKQWLELLAESGTPLFLSIDPESATPEITEDIRNAIQTFLARAASGEPAALPLDWMETRTPARWLISGTEKHFSWE